MNLVARLKELCLNFDLDFAFFNEERYLNEMKLGYIPCPLEFGAKCPDFITFFPEKENDCVNCIHSIKCVNSSDSTTVNSFLCHLRDEKIKKFHYIMDEFAHQFIGEEDLIMYEDFEQLYPNMMWSFDELMKSFLIMLKECYELGLELNLTRGVKESLNQRYGKLRKEND